MITPEDIFKELMAPNISILIDMHKGRDVAFTYEFNQATNQGVLCGYKMLLIEDAEEFSIVTGEILPMKDWIESKRLWFIHNYHYDEYIKIQKGPKQEKYTVLHTVMPSYRDRFTVNFNAPLFKLNVGEPGYINKEKVLKDIAKEAIEKAKAIGQSFKHQQRSIF